MHKLPSEMIGDQSKESDGWRRWWIFAVASWLLLFAGGFVALFQAWNLANQERTKEIADEMMFYISIPVACVLISNLFAGLYVLINRTLRRKLLSLPAPAALACLSLSFIIAALCMVSYSIADLGWHQFIHGPGGAGSMNLEEMKSGLAVGIMAFPLTFGLVFPLGMPLGAAIFLYLTIKARGSITPMSWIAALAFSIFGWWLLVIVGLALGMGG